MNSPGLDFSFLIYCLSLIQKCNAHISDSIKSKHLVKTTTFGLNTPKMW